MKITDIVDSIIEKTNTNTTNKLDTTIIHSATSKTTPVDSDELALLDSESSFSLKKLTFANLKDTLKTYFDGLYATITKLNLKASLDSPTFTGTPTAPTATANTNTTQLATTEFVQNSQKNAPSFDSGVSMSYNTVYKVSNSCLLVVMFQGSYMNGIQVLVGSSSSPSNEIARHGDDLNANIKAGSFHIPLKAGTYFKVTSQTIGASDGYGFESIWIYTYDFK